jgi:hypothetical protein
VDEEGGALHQPFWTRDRLEDAWGQIHAGTYNEDPSFSVLHAQSQAPPTPMTQLDYVRVLHLWMGSLSPVASSPSTHTDTNKDTNRSSVWLAPALLIVTHFQLSGQRDQNQVNP